MGKTILTKTLMRSDAVKFLATGKVPKSKWLRTAQTNRAFSGHRCQTDTAEVHSGGWDMHKELEDAMEDRGGEFDRAFAALVADLDARGLLDSTLVAVTTEFGRKPSFEGNGRGHHPLAFSTVLAGGGAKRGFVYGSSDAKGYKAAENPVTPGDFHATVAWAAGMPIEKEAMSPSGRPFTVGNKGKPALGVFA